jgi:Winged helix DNA-binding domain
MSQQTISARALNRATLARQMLLARDRMKPVRAVERVAGMQAQVPRPPFVGLWTRLEGFKREDLLTAIERREVVRGTLMRGTIHLVSTKDYVTFRQTLQPALSAALSILKDRIRTEDIPAVVKQGTAFFTQGAGTFAALRDQLKRGASAVDERALAYIIRLHLPLVQTPSAGAAWGYAAAAEFAIAEKWIGQPVEANEYPEALATRYLAAFGPATPNDFKTWSGLPAAREIFAALAPKLVVLRDDRKRELFDLPKAPRPDKSTEAPVRFLPEFDNLLLAYSDKSRFVEPPYQSRLTTKNLLLPATFMVDGIVAGTWAVTTARQAATLTLTPFGTVGKAARKALDEEGNRLVRFVEPDAGTYDVAWSKSATVKR